MVAATQNKLLSTDKSAEQGQPSSPQPLATPKAREFLPQSTSNTTEEASRIRALLNTKETVERTAVRQNSTPRPQREKLQSAKHAHHVAEDRAGHERSDRMAFRQIGGATQNRQQAQATPRAGSRPGTQNGLVHDEKEHLHSSTPAPKAPLSAPLTGMNSSASNNRAAEEGVQRNSDRTTAASALTAGTGTSEGISQGPGTVVVKLLDLVGPEATLTLKERLKEVWVNLDNTAASELDVIARMPANELGLSNSELLTVQSPQGVHFVAFLRNRNDFEVLQTFDRHSLLPGNPTKQLMEAAVMAYEQLGLLFKEGSALLEKKVKTLPDKNSSDREVLDGVRGQWVSAKRRRKKCSELVEQLLERIDEVEIQEQRAESQEATSEPDSSERSTTKERVIKPEFERPVLKNDDEE